MPPIDLAYVQIRRRVFSASFVSRRENSTVEFKCFSASFYSRRENSTFGSSRELPACYTARGGSFSTAGQVFSASRVEFDLCTTQTNWP